MKNTMKNTQKTVIIFLSLLLCTTVVYIPSTMALSKSINAPLIISLGDSPEVNYTIEKITKFIPEARILQIQNLNELETTLQKTNKIIIYVGHGRETGLSTANSLISWKNIEKLIDNSPSNNHLIASCYSDGVKADGKTVLGFSGPVDVDQAAMHIVAYYFGVNGRISEIPSVIEYFTNVLIDKIIHPETTYRAFLLDTVYVHDTWWALQPGDYQCPTPYTHPDTWETYTDVTMNTFASSWYDGFGCTHIPKYLLDGYNFDAIIITSLTATVLEVAAQAGTVGVLVALLISAMIVTMGFTATVIIDNFVRDGVGAGWSYQKNLWSDWWGMGVNHKLGGIMWFDMGFSFGVPYCTPLWYGGADLGIWGI